MAQNCKCPACNPINQPNFEYVAPQKLTLKEKLHKQRMERFADSDRAFEYSQANQGRYAEHRASVLAERKMAKTGYLDSFNDVRDSVSDVIDDAIGAVKQVGNDLIASQRAMLAEHLVDNGVVQVTDTTTGEKLAPDKVAERYRETSTFDISDAEESGANAIKSIPAYGSVLFAVETVTSKGKNVLKRKSKSRGRAGKQKRLREMMNDPKVSSADRGWLINDERHIKYGNKSGLRIPRNGRKSPGRKAEDKGYELAHPHDSPASKGNNYADSKLKNHADHKVETRLHKHRY